MGSLGQSGIYDDLMRFRPEGLTANAWAVAAGVSRTVWADMKRHGNPSRRTLEKLLIAAGSSLAEFEALRISGPAAEDRPAGAAIADRHAGWAPAQLPPLPLTATTAAGEWGGVGSGIEITGLVAGKVVDRVARPASLAGDGSAYAVTIVGESMWPRFRRGRRIAVSPRADIASGDDVLVKLKRQSPSEDARLGPTPVLIEELVRIDESSVELRQFNPPCTFAVPRTEIDAIEKVIGELI